MSIITLCSHGKAGTYGSIDVKRVAVRKIRDQSRLEKIALKASNGKVRGTAIRRLENKQLLLEISRNDQSKECKQWTACMVDPAKNPKPRLFFGFLNRI